MVVYDKCFHSRSLFARYWIRMFIYLFVFVACVFACNKVCSLVSFDWNILTFVVRGIICEVLCVAVIGVSFIPSEEHRVAVQWLVSKVKGKLLHGQK
jgi:hypothetical protein